MPNQSFRSAGVLMLLGVAVSACQDLATGPDAAPKPASPLSSVGGNNGNGYAHGRDPSLFVCYATALESESPVRYRYINFTLDFPKSAQAPNGATTVYRYRLMREDGSGDPLGAATCRIPKTEEAVAIMNRRLKVEKMKSSARKSGGEELVSTMGCPEGGCPIEGLIAYGYARPTYPYSNSTGTSGCWYSCGWGASYWDGGSGSEWDPYWPYPENHPGEPCATGDVFVDDQTVGEGFKQMWEASNYGTGGTPLGDRKEQYGWIVKTETGYRVHHIGSGNACGADFNPVAPQEGYDSVVGFVHTHPYALGEAVFTCGADGRITGVTEYGGTPSSFDRNASIQLGNLLGRGDPLAGLILDADGIRTFKGHDQSMDGNLGRCAY